MLRLEGSFSSTSRHQRIPFNAAVVTAPLGTCAALALIPADVSQPGSLVLSACLLTLGLLGGLFVDVVDDGVRSALRAEHIAVLGVVIVTYIEAVQFWYSIRLPSEMVSNSFLAIGVFVTAVALGASFAPRRLPRVLIGLATREYSPDLAFYIMWACSILAMLSFAIASDFSIGAMLNGLLADRWSAPWSRGQLGDWSAFRDFLQYFGYFVPSFTVMIALQRGTWTHRQVLVGLLCSAVTLAFISQNGGRRLPAVIVGAALVTWLCAKADRLRPRHYISVAILLAGIVLLMDFMLETRNTGLASEMNSAAYSVDTFKGVRVDDNLYNLSQILDVFPTEEDFVGFRLLAYVIVRPIPRVLWPGKPVDAGFDLAKHLGEPGVSLSLTAVGEWYMSFGWAGIVVGGVLMGLLARNWSQLLDLAPRTTTLALYGMGAMAIFLGVRSLLELVLTSYPILCWIAIDLIVYNTKKQLAALEGSAFSEIR